MKRSHFRMVLAGIVAVLLFGLAFLGVKRMVLMGDNKSRVIAKYSSCRVDYLGKTAEVIEPEGDGVRALWNRVIRDGYCGTENRVADEFNFFSGNYTVFSNSNGVQCKVYWWNLWPSMAKIELNQEVFYCRVSSADSAELDREFKNMVSRGQLK